ncbi:TPR domain protein2C putative component of TonB system [gamma proteobacterium IMCC2047]|nr:TPR domain protein2C putative component of TonB system [gamma proteobacterium IMCC2047]
MATASAYQKALAEQGMPEGLRNELMYSLAQVYFLQEKYADSLALIERWLKRVPKAGNEASIFIAKVYYQQQQYQRALPFARRAVSAYENENKRVPEHWYLLLNALYYELKDYRNSFKVTLALINFYPKKIYYTQLSGLYGELGQDFKQFSIQQALSDAGLLEKSSEWVGFSQFLLHNRCPFRAAQLLETGLEKGVVEGHEKNLKLLANAWLLAREDQRALQPLAAAAKLSDDGELYMLLAQAYANLERWQEAASSRA